MATGSSSGSSLLKSINSLPHSAKNAYFAHSAKTAKAGLRPPRGASPRGGDGRWRRGTPRAAARAVQRADRRRHAAGGSRPGRGGSARGARSFRGRRGAAGGAGAGRRPRAGQTACAVHAWPRHGRRGAGPPRQVCAAHDGPAHAARRRQRRQRRGGGGARRGGPAAVRGRGHTGGARGAAGCRGGAGVGGLRAWVFSKKLTMLRAHQA
eukprot:scaffold26167_cov59-Phaeocystis_antarctica.AAC.3